LRGSADRQVEPQVAIDDRYSIGLLGRTDSGSSAATTRFSVISRCRTGDSVPDGIVPARLPAFVAILA
jgi:hypothetical protein